MTSIITSDLIQTLHNIQDYGADPLGVRDAAGAIQDAINACITAGGGVVLIPAGTYKLNTSPSYGTATHVTIVQFTGVTYTGAGSMPVNSGTNRTWTIGDTTSGSSFTGGVTITLPAAGTALALENDDPGATGVVVDNFHNSASPAVNDELARRTLRGKDGAGNATTYAQEQVFLSDPTDTSEDGLYRLSVMIGGVLQRLLDLDANGLTVSLKNGSAQGLRLTMADDGTVGVQLVTFHDSATPAVADLLRDDQVFGRDAGANATMYGRQRWVLVDPTDASEDAELNVDVLAGGTLQNISKHDAQGFWIKFGSLILNGGSAPTPTTDGAMQWDTDDDAIVVGDGAAQAIFGKLTSTTPSAIGTAAAGSAKQSARSDHAHAMTSASAALAADATMSVSGTFVDGPSVSLAAGTWLVFGKVTIANDASIHNFTGKLWDGTTAVDSGEVSIQASAKDILSFHAIVSPGGTTTYKISVANNGGTNTIKAATPDSPAGNNASTLWAVRIA